MKTIEENNQIIGKFIGWIPYNGLNPKWNYSFETNNLFHVNNCVTKDELQFHTSWDWLMPVVEKIEWGLNNGENFWIKVSKIYGEQSYISSVYYGGYDNGKPFEITSNEYFKTKLEATYNAVIQFIEWYNEQKS